MCSPSRLEVTNSFCFRSACLEVSKTEVLLFFLNPAMSLHTETPPSLWAAAPLSEQDDSLHAELLLNVCGEALCHCLISD
jgi:hypothetical protein